MVDRRPSCVLVIGCDLGFAFSEERHRARRIVVDSRNSQSIKWDGLGVFIGRLVGKKTSSWNGKFGDVAIVIITCTDSSHGPATIDCGVESGMEGSKRCTHTKLATLISHTPHSLGDAQFINSRNNQRCTQQHPKQSYTDSLQYTQCCMIFLSNCLSLVSLYCPVFPEQEYLNYLLSVESLRGQLSITLLHMGMQVLHRKQAGPAYWQGLSVDIPCGLLSS